MSANESWQAVQLQAKSLANCPLPFANSTFVLNSTAMAGLLGGEEATSTVALTQIYDRRKWLGWYNSPGSYVMGKHFRRLARSAKVDIVYDNGPESGTASGSQMVHIDPTLLFEHEGWSKGPAFKGIFSGTSIDATGPLASQLMKKATKEDCRKVDGRTTQPVNVTVAILEQVDSLRQQMTFNHRSPLLAILPIVASLTTCLTCGLYRQWWAFSMILVGILARGFACLLIGSGNLVFDHPKPAEGSPPGDGVLGSDQDFVLLKGNEYVVNAVTRGRFFFRFRSKYACCMVEWCSILLIVQAIAQLVFIPQSKLFGQLMFVVSLAFSWAYDLWFSSFDKGEVQEAIFQQVLGKPSLIKFVFPNRVSAVVFLLVSNDNPRTSGNPRKLKKILDIFLPSNSEVWEIWKDTITERLKNRQALQFSDTHWNREELTLEDDRKLLKTLFGDAKDAEKAYAIFKNHDAGIIA
ncbi:hypothetical protein M404DRAFT_25185 [Pisolithus tinctorius Marx 270]|uniref:Uncharacterized protein n=1 Tax=Pisolithus tinctorius Marx 270 TaxID=870435 RepID=A0A0C3JA79_PISTI|nr:hypothetical protein M404DRAFT_25185 [Pisolithus tinctorius Marx 270]